MNAYSKPNVPFPSNARVHIRNGFPFSYWLEVVRGQTSKLSVSKCPIRAIPQWLRANKMIWHKTSMACWLVSVHVGGPIVRITSQLKQTWKGHFWNRQNRILPPEDVSAKCVTAEKTYQWSYRHYRVLLYYKVYCLVRYFCDLFRV